jgi:hypothetical protein
MENQFLAGGVTLLECFCVRAFAAPDSWRLSLVCIVFSALYATAEIADILKLDA